MSNPFAVTANAEPITTVTQTFARTAAQPTKVGIVIPVLNNFKGAIELVESIRTEHEYKIYLMDQWKHPDRPLSEAWNLGFDRAKADGATHIFILNDDILFNKTSVDNAVKEYDRLSTEKVALVSLNNVFGEYQNKIEDFYNWNQPYSVPIEVADHPNYSAFLVGPDFFDKVGRFDENFQPAWFEDNDNHRRINLLGMRAICTVASSCLHYGGVTTAMLAPERKSSEKSSQYYVKKWGGLYEGAVFLTPYNNPNLTPKDWTPNYA